MRKNINKLATLVMTGALAASMSFGAFAAESPDKTITIAKNVTTDANNKTSAPKTAFKLSVTAGPSDKTSVTLKDKNDHDTEYVVTPGTAGQATEIAKTLVDADFSNVTTATNGVYTANFAATVKASLFEAPGVYSFKVKEVNTKYTGITYDPTATDETKFYTMYVSVINSGSSLKVDNVVLAKENGDKISSITNDFGSDNTDGGTTHDLTITKALSGNAAEPNKAFGFTISIAPKVAANSEIVAPATQEFTLTKTAKDGTTATETVTASGSHTYTLKGTETIKIEGLTEDYEVSVIESDAGTGYTTTYVTENVDDNTEDTDYTVKDNKRVITSSSNVKVQTNNDNATLTITNERDNVTPTGVAMDIAPYALMVALAGGAAATFLRKKESFED